MNFARGLDWKLVAPALALTGIGVALIYSAFHASASPDGQAFWIKQVIWAVVSFVAMLIVARLPLKFFDLTAYIFYAVAFILLVLVLFVGHTRLGATRWFDFGPISVTPSDIAKVALLVALARFLAYSRKGGTESKRNLLISALLTILVMVPVLKQPDLGTALIFVAMLIGLWYWSGAPLLHLAIIATPLVSLLTSAHVVTWILFFVGLLVFLYFARPTLWVASGVVVLNLIFGIVTPFVWNGLKDYQKLRIITFLDPGQDPKGAGYQIIQSQISIGSGGWTGKGYLQSTQSRLEYLPERHTDFIFSILGEEWGFIGALVALALFGFLLYRMIYIAGRCRSRFSSYVVFGAAAVMLFQVVANVGMTVGLMPVTGTPLPFVSYGGTSLMFCWTLIGLTLSADASWQEY